MNILIIKTSSMGDLVHTYPAITECKRHFPEAHFTWLCEENFAEVAQLHPAISDIKTLSIRRWRKNWLSVPVKAEISTLKAILNTGAWDKVIDCQGLLKSAIPTFWAGQNKTAITHGYDFSSAKESWASFFYQYKWPVNKQNNAVSRNKKLFGLALGYEANLTQVDFGLDLSQFTRPDLVDDCAYAVFLHASSDSHKLWPVSYWVALGLALDQPILLPWGNEAEKDTAQKIAKQIPKARVLPFLSVSHLANLLANANAVVGVDTGLTHLANALHVPLVAIYTDTNPEKTGIYEHDFARNIGQIKNIPNVESVFKLLLNNINKFIK
ncbi:MAG: lipopolysaccharide heptosyltransferase I [Neisseriaceae bacterium]|nr:lipopolysaccharide heptosyltransferase I [Neisseriaceae bacterium]